MWAEAAVGAISDDGKWTGFVGDFGLGLTKPASLDPVLTAVGLLVVAVPPVALVVATGLVTGRFAGSVLDAAGLVVVLEGVALGHEAAAVLVGVASLGFAGELLEFSEVLLDCSVATSTTSGASGIDSAAGVLTESSWVDILLLVRRRLGSVSLLRRRRETLESSLWSRFSPMRPSFSTATKLVLIFERGLGASEVDEAANGEIVC